VIDAFEISNMIIKILTEPVHVSYDDVPRFFKEQIVKSIWPRSLVIREIKDDLVNFYYGERIAEKIKVIVSLNQILKINLHGGFNCRPKSPFELMPEKSTFPTMTLHHSASIITI
jgi:hypothetical protein